MCYKPFISKAEGGVSRGSLATVLTALQRCCSPYQPYKTCGFPYTALLCWLSISRALTNPTLTKAKLLFDCSASRSSRRFASTALQIEELHAQPCKSKSCTHSLRRCKRLRTNSFLLLSKRKRFVRYGELCSRLLHSRRLYKPRRGAA